MVTLTRTLALFLLLLPAVRAAAQPAAPDTAAQTWTTNLVTRLSASQVGYQNWTEGGANTLATTAAVEGKAEGTTTDWSQTYEARLLFGIVKQDTIAVRKAEDLIRLRTAFQYRGEGFFKTLNPTVAADVNTQFAAGYNFKKNPFEDGRVPPVKVSHFFSPATFTQSVGLTYGPRPWFSQRLGVGSKQTVVLIERFRPLYNLAPDQAVRLEVGLEARTTFDREVVENIRYKSSLGLFAAFNRPDVPDLLWENLIAMKVNAWIGVNLEFTTLFDRDMSDDLQFKEALSVGFSFTFV